MSKSLAQLQAQAVETHAVQLGPGMEYYGQQWGDVYSNHFEPITTQLRKLIADSPGAKWLEIGPGGGRWTRHLLDLDRHMTVTLVDGTPAAAKLTRIYLGDELSARVERFVVCKDGELLIDPSLNSQRFTNAFSFDVFVHFPPLLFWNYLESVADLLKTGGSFGFNYARKFPCHRGWRDGTGCFEYYNPRAIAAWLKVCGMKIRFEHSLEAGFGSHFVVAEKM